MKRGGAIVLLLLAACAAPPPPSSGVARWRGGELSFEELEAEARNRLPRTVAGTGMEEVLASYRRVAEEMAARALLSADGESVARVEEAWQPELATLEIQAAAQVYAADLLPQVRVSEAEIEAWYREHVDEYQRPETRWVAHLFQRRRPDADVLANLAELRKRVLSGERFEDLARAESDSETRLLGGDLGWIERGLLPPALERVVFALEAGQVSAPVRVDGGGVLFYVREVRAEERYALADVRQSLLERLRGDKLDALFAESPSALPAGSRILAGDEIAAVLARAAPAEAVLAAGDYRLTAADFRRLLAAGAAGGAAPDPVATYVALARSLRLTLMASAAGFPATPDQDRRRREAARRSREAFVGGKLLEDALWRRIDADEPALRAFYERHAQRYLSPLRLRLKVLAIEDLSDPQGSMRRLEELRRRSQAGAAVDLESAAAALGGSVADLGWVDFAALRSLPQKVQTYLFEVDGTGLTIPFQLNESLRLLEVVERREPQPSSFDEAREAVRRSYFERHGQELYRRMLDEMLAAADFELDEALLHARLWPGAGGLY